MLSLELHEETKHEPLINPDLTNTRNKTTHWSSWHWMDVAASANTPSSSSISSLRGLRLSDDTRPIFEVEELNSSAFVMVVTILIVLGLVMLIVAVLGDYGACNEKRCALQVFSVLLFLLALAVVVVGALANSNMEEVGSTLAEFYTSLYTLYVTSEGDPFIRVTLTFFHHTLLCCGLTGVTLIEVVKEICSKPTVFFEYIKRENCPVTIRNVVETNAPLVTGFFVAAGLLLIIAMICSLVLSKSIRQSTVTQCVILTQPTPNLVIPQPPQQEFVSTSYSYVNKNPVVFTPLSVVNVPVAQS